MFHELLVLFVRVPFGQNPDKNDKMNITRKAWFLKKQGKSQASWTSSCKIFLKLNGSPEEAKVLVVRDIKELEIFNWLLALLEVK